MAISGNKKHTGLIPIVTDDVYKTNYKINDDSTGRYLSLIGSRTFYNPGIDLIVESPDTEPVTINSGFKSTYNGGQASANITGNRLKNAFLIFDNKNVTFDEIPGMVTNNLAVNNFGVSNITDITQMVAPGNVRILNVTKGGDYYFRFYSKGSVVIQSNNGPFSAQLAFYYNINGTETAFGGIGGNTNNGNHNQQVELSYNVILENTFTLKTGDYFQIYGKIVTSYDKEFNSVYFNCGTTSLQIDLSSIEQPPSNFTNPLGIAAFKTSSIKFYGAERDNLILQGNKLTNS